MNDKEGVVAEVVKGLIKQAEVAAPEKLVRADGKVGVQKDFQSNTI